MSYMFTVSPDFSPDRLSGWYIFNTWVQRQMGADIHLELYDDFCAQRVATYSNKIDLIYANPFDAAMLVREKGFLPLVKPVGLLDEALIAVSENSAVEKLDDLKLKYIQFPGGCTAESYKMDTCWNWKNSIGPLEQRAVPQEAGGYIKMIFILAWMSICNYAKIWEVNRFTHHHQE